MDATVVWKKGVSFKGKAFTSSFTLPVGADPKASGDNDGLRPAELILAGSRDAVKAGRQSGSVGVCEPR